VKNSGIQNHTNFLTDIFQTFLWNFMVLEIFQKIFQRFFFKKKFNGFSWKLELDSNFISHQKLYVIDKSHDNIVKLMNIIENNHRLR